MSPVAKGLKSLNDSNRTIFVDDNNSNNLDDGTLEFPNKSGCCSFEKLLRNIW